MFLLRKIWTLSKRLYFHLDIVHFNSVCQKIAFGGWKKNQAKPRLINSHCSPYVVAKRRRAKELEPSAILVRQTTKKS